MGTDTEDETLSSRKFGHHIHEEWGDLFSAPLSTSLAHCVSSDMKMGAGIAVRFRQKFGHIEDLLLQGKTTGEVAFLKEGPRFIFYLVTKDRFFNKPTENTLRSSLVEMKALCRNLGVKKLAMPRVGCGLDGLKWPSVLKMINEVFWNGGIHITIYSINQMSSPAASYERISNGTYSCPGVMKRSYTKDFLLRSEPYNKRRFAHSQSQRGESSLKYYISRDSDESPDTRKQKYSVESPLIEPSKQDFQMRRYLSRDGDGSPELTKRKHFEGGRPIDHDRRKLIEKNHLSRESDRSPDTRKRKYSEERSLTELSRWEPRVRRYLSRDGDGSPELKKRKHLEGGRPIDHERHKSIMKNNLSRDSDGSPEPEPRKQKYSEERQVIDHPRWEPQVRRFFSRGSDGSPDLKKKKHLEEERPVHPFVKKEISDVAGQTRRGMLKGEAPDFVVKLRGDDRWSSKTKSPRSIERVDESPANCLSETEISSSEMSTTIRHVDVSDRIRVELYTGCKKNKDRSICHSDIESSETISPRMKPVHRNSKKEEADNRQCSPLTPYQDLCSSSKRKRNEDEDMGEEVGSRAEDKGVKKSKKGKKKKLSKEDAIEHKKKSKDRKQEIANGDERSKVRGKYEKLANEEERRKVREKYEKYALKLERLCAEEKQAIQRALDDEDKKKRKIKKGRKEEDGKKKEKKKKKSDKNERKIKSTKKSSRCEEDKVKKKRKRRSEQTTKEKLEKEVKSDKNESLKDMLNEIYQQVKVENMKDALSDTFKMKSLKNEEDITDVKKGFKCYETKKRVNNHYSQLNVVNCVEKSECLWEDSE